MKGYRFYAEMPEARKSKAASNAFPLFPWTVAALREKAQSGEFNGHMVNRAPCVVAVALQSDGRPYWNNDGTLEAVSVGIDGNHHSYCWTSVSPEYLRIRCTRIPEELARKLSPELFRRLES